MHRRGAGRQLPSLAIACVVLLSTSCASRPTSALPQTPTPTPAFTLTPADRAQLTQLEARPLRLPTRLPDGRCPEAPQSTIRPYLDTSTPLANPIFGTGPVYVEGGAKTLSSKYAYFDVTYFTDPTVSGLVLVRGQQVDGPHRWLFTGNYAVGPTIDTDRIDGQTVLLHQELALPAEHVPTDPTAATGWGIWKIRQAVDISVDRLANPCTGEQLDTLSSSEVFAA